jgi:putative DNA primase/helicase
MVVPRSLKAEDVTPAALFRRVEMARPTLLIDEADTFLSPTDPDGNDLRLLLNAGHKPTGRAVRTAGDNHEPREYTVFVPAGIAGIGNLPGTLGDPRLPSR